VNIIVLLLDETERSLVDKTRELKIRHGEDQEAPGDS